MRVISHVLLVLLCLAATSYAQEDPVAPVTPDAAAPTPTFIKFHDMESLAISALRKEFPRLSGVFASAHSCRLPDYGPMVSVTIQLPAYYFTKPVLQELDRRQRAAEEQARKVRTQLERASQVISLRSKEAALQERIEWEESSKKKSKEAIEELKTQLSEVRKSLDLLQPDTPATMMIGQQSSLLLNDVDLNKMLASNYQHLIQRVTKAMAKSLAEHAPRIEDLDSDERVTLNTYIRDSVLGSPGKSILFILHHDDIQDYKQGNIDVNQLLERVVVQDQPRN